VRLEISCVLKPLLVLISGLLCRLLGKRKRRLREFVLVSAQWLLILVRDLPKATMGNILGKSVVGYYPCLHQRLVFRADVQLKIFNRALCRQCFLNLFYSELLYL